MRVYGLGGQDATQYSQLLKIMLKASALGKAPEDEDIRQVQSAVGPEEQGLPTDTAMIFAAAENSSGFQTKRYSRQPHPRKARCRWDVVC